MMHARASIDSHFGTIYEWKLTATPTGCFRLLRKTGQFDGYSVQRDIAALQHEATVGRYTEVWKTLFFEQFIYIHDNFANTGSGQT
jgi:hypothetical protein